MAQIFLHKNRDPSVSDQHPHKSAARCGSSICSSSTTGGRRQVMETCDHSVSLVQWNTLSQKKKLESNWGKHQHQLWASTLKHVIPPIHTGTQANTYVHVCTHTHTIGRVHQYSKMWQVWTTKKVSVYDSHVSLHLKKRIKRKSDFVHLSNSPHEILSPRYKQKPCPLKKLRTAEGKLCKNS